MSILDKIVRSRLNHLESQKDSIPLERIKSELEPSQRDFASALRSPRPGFILECKKASPSKGLIRSDFDLSQIAGTYARHASAISVLTESEYFQGSLANLGIVRQIAPQPLLCKDFIVDPYQVYQARHFGADAILLILAILDDAAWNELFAIARSLGMDVLTEVSNEAEQQRAIRLGAPIVGINNRNLRDMSIDLDNTRRLAQGLAADTVVVSESGYHNHSQIREMKSIADAFLIGSSLMAESNLDLAVKQMIFGDTKVCGLTRNQDACCVDRAGAVYGGVIFAESSPRYVAPTAVKEIFSGTTLIRVGVFQDHDGAALVDAVSQAELSVIQLHGQESQEMLGWVKERLPGIQIWKALSLAELLEQGQAWLDAGVDRLVVDNHAAGQRGGTGKAFDWSGIPQQLRRHVMLAGGIGPENLAAALATGCTGIDMNSALESAPGVKSEAKVRAAFDIIRESG